MLGCHGSLLFIAVILALASSAGVQRDFPGNYTIVNWANGRRISWTARGFAANKHGPISDDFHWRLLPQGNATFAIVNCKSNMRILAQSGTALETGFFAVDNGPILPDQKWHLDIQEDGSYTVKNVRSGRRVAARSDAEGALGVTAIQPGSAIRGEERWWLINQVKDEAGQYIVKLESEQNARAKLAQAFKDKVSNLASCSLQLRNDKSKFGREITLYQAEASSLKQSLDVEKRVNVGLSERVASHQKESDSLRSKVEAEVDAKAKLSEVVQAARGEVRNLSSQLVAERFAKEALSEQVDAKKGVLGCLSPFQSDDPSLQTTKLVFIALVVVVFSALVPYVGHRLRAAHNKVSKMSVELASVRSVKCRLTEENAAIQAKIAELEQRGAEDAEPSTESSGELGFDFAHQVFNFEMDQAIMRLIKIQCPGVEHEDVQVQLIFNGCEVAIHRKASRGVQETTFRKRFSLKASEGLFEFKEDQMQLEPGFLHLVFKAYPFQSRVIRFPQHFSMDADDADMFSWEYAAESLDDSSVDLRVPASVMPCPFNDADARTEFATDAFEEASIDLRDMVPIKPCSFHDTDSTASTRRIQAAQPHDSDSCSDF